jgi:hypothetical protein
MCAVMGVLVLAAMAWADAPPKFQDAESMLDALEQADRGMTTFASSIVYDRRFMLQDDRHVRTGKLYFQVRGSDGDRLVRSFGVHFNHLLIDNVNREERSAWIFDGEWLVEKRFAQKQYVARQIARPGQRLDPLRLGQGRLPLPIGQRKVDILARYDVRLLPPDDGFEPGDAATANYATFVSDAQQLELTPKPGMGEDQFRTIRLWYGRLADGRLVPKLSRTVDRKGDEIFVQLIGPRINEPLPEGVTDIARPAHGTGWDVQIERGRFESDDSGDTESDKEPS